MNGKILLPVLFIFIRNVGGFTCNLDSVCGNGTFVKYYPYSDVCKPCFCSRECSQETACPLFDNINEDYEVCKHQLNFFGQMGLQILNLSGYLKMWYFVVFRCPPDTDEELIAACESMNNTEDNRYVSSVSTYRIYKNKYCAQCNGENNFIKWRTAVYVNDDEMSYMLNDVYAKQMPLDLTVYRDKPLISAPPSGYPWYTNVCDQNVISKCTDSGAVDENVVKLCKLSKFPIVRDFSNQYYRNFYCALCNEETSALCPVFYKPELYLKSYHRLLYLEDVLLSNVSKQGDEVLEYSCNYNQIVDPLGGMCMNLTCAIGYIPIMGECMAREATALEGFTFYFHVVYQTSEEIDWYEQMSLMYWVHDQLDAAECDRCQGTIIPMASFTFNGYESFTLSPKCNTTKLAIAVQDFEKIISVENSFNYSDGTFYARLKLNYELRVVEHPQCKADIRLWQKFYCSSVVMTPDILSKLEAFGVSEEIHNVSEPLINPNNEVQFNSRVICLSDYKSVIQEFVPNDIEPEHEHTTVSNGFEHLHTTTCVAYYMFICLFLFCYVFVI